MKTLVGYTGFVGSNIAAAGKFDALYNSENIADAYGTNPDLLVYAGVYAEKYLANHTPEKDMACILQAEDNIRKINPGQIVLIPTVDVFKIPRNVDEASSIDTVGLHPYGYNRYQLELWVREHYPDALIVRLPGLFGKNLKKNFIYDYIHRIPSMLSEEKIHALAEIEPGIKKFYSFRANGFYKVNVKAQERKRLKELFKKCGFSALNFTDSRSVYQFYNLADLWGDIQTALKEGIRLLHLATEPISAGELYEYLTGEKFVNEISKMPADYDYKTIHNVTYGGSRGYIRDKEQVLNDIRTFVAGEVHDEMD